MNRIKFGELRINDIAKRHVQDCLDSNNITMGEKTFLLERKWRELFGYRYSRFMSSGTTAGTASCMVLNALGANSGDEVIVPALSFIATSNAVRMANLTPVFVDIRRETLNINENLIESRITPRTRAIKIVNTMGRPVNMKQVEDIAKRRKLVLIVDGCESSGCKYKDKYCLEYADMETSSHYAAHLTISGEGGMVCSNNEEMDKLLQSIRSHGRPHGSLYFDHQHFGGNFKNTDLHASIGLGEVDVFWENFTIRHKNMKKIDKGLKDYKQYFWTSEEDRGNVNCPHGYSITFKDPKYNIEKFKKHLDKAGIDQKRNFGCIPTQHKSFACFGYNLGDFPESEYVGDNGIHFGIHRYLSEEDIGRIINTVRDYFDGKKWNDIF